MRLYQKIIAGGVILAGLTGLVGCDSSPPPRTKVEQRYVDMNSDYVKDIITVSASSSDDSWKSQELRKHKAIISMSQSDGSYQDQVIQYNEQPLELKIEDINNDGRQDILVIVANNSDDFWKRQELRKFDLVVSYQNEDGTFQPQKVIKTYNERPN